MIQSPPQQSTVPVAKPVAPKDPSAVRPGERISVDALHEIEAAKKRSAKIRRAVGIARFSGGTTGLFAAVSVVAGIFSLPSLIIGLALAVIAYNELRGARTLAAFDERAAKLLGRNQLGLCAILIAYAIWGLMTSLTGPKLFDTPELAGAADVTAALDGIEQLQTMITLAVYGSLIPASLIFQGGMAWYYYSRKRHLEIYLSATPDWVISLQRDA